MLRNETKKALEEFVAAREEVDTLLPLRDNKETGPEDMKKLCAAFEKERSARKRYYDLLAEDMSWSKEEKEEWYKGAGLEQNGPCPEKL